MKKILTTCAFALIVLLGSTEAFSQMRVGVKGGVNYANVLEKGELNPDAIFGGHAGLVLYSNLEKAVFFQTGIMFSQNGAKMKADSDFIDMGEVKLTYNNIEIPLNVGFQIPISDNFKIAPYLGGYGAYAISGKFKFGDESVDIFKDADVDFIDRLDYGANFGLGFHVNNRFIVSGQYSRSLKNQIEGNVDESYNSVISLGLSFLF